MLVTLVSWFYMCTYPAHLLTGFVLLVGGVPPGPGRRRLSAIWRITRWPTLLAISALFATVPHMPLAFALSYVGWASVRNAGDDDDDLKRWLKKTREKVIRSLGRLVVVPATTSG